LRPRAHKSTEKEAQIAGEGSTQELSMIVCALEKIGHNSSELIDAIASKENN